MKPLDEQLLDMGFDCAVGVPDSHLATLMGRLGESFPVHTAPREDVAVAAACGMRLAGGNPMLYMKNAGLFACGDALLSLARDMEISLFLLIGWAGVGSDNLPHHVVSGERTTPFLDSLGIPWHIAGDTDDDSAATTVWYERCRRERTHHALLVPPGGIRAH